MQSLNLKSLEELLDEGNISAKRLFYLIENNNYLIITISISSLISSFFMYFFLINFILKFSFINKIFISFIGLSFILFLNIILKFHSSKDPEKFTLKITSLINIMFYLLYPLTSLINKVFNKKISSISKNLSCFKKEFNEEQIKDLVEIGQESGLLEQYETKIINSALNIDKTSVESIITPRVDMKCIHIDTEIEDALKFMLDEEYSRMPVYEDSIDNITGVIHIKDLVKAVRKKNNNNNNKNLKSLMRPAFHVPENKLVIDLLKEMQLKGLQIVIVSDEFGGTAGIITMEDILEEIVGEIRDEHDTDEKPNITKVDDNTLIVNPMINISEINSILDLELPNSQSVSKFIIDTIGDLPNINQEINLDEINIKILKLDGKRIQEVMITKKNKIIENDLEDKNAS